MNNRNRERTFQETGKDRDYINRKDLSLKNHLFLGHDLIWVLDFLDQSVNEARVQKIREAQALITFPSFIEVRVLIQYESGVGVATQNNR